MSRRFALLFLVILLSLVPVAGACAEEPLLSMVYTGNTLGTFQPCPTCEQDKSLGGLGRRSTFFKQFMASHSRSDKVLILAGGHEFLPFRVRSKFPAGFASALVKAYGLLPCDLGYVTARERDWLREDGAEPPKGWLVADGDRPKQTVLAKGDMRVGVVIFPGLADPLSRPSAAVEAECAAVCGKLRDEVDLLIAMSPWGERAERVFLDKFGPVSDILLGSGPAVGAGLRPMLDSRVLWVRAQFDGRYIPVLKILDRPAFGKGWAWMVGANYDFSVIPMDDEVRIDPVVNNVFAWI